MQSAFFMQKNKEVKEKMERTQPVIPFEEVEKAAKPLVELLREKGHPHMTALVTGRGVEITETVVGVPMPYDD